MDTEFRKPLIVGNWKMHGNLTDSLKIVANLKNLITDFPDLDVVLAPPYTSLFSVSVILSETPFQLGAQNLFWEDEGAYTGEICGSFLKEIGCNYVLIGHSERRQYFNETDETVNLKIQAAFKNELIPIVCIGERAEDRQKGKTFEVLEKQLKGAFKNIAIHDFDNLVVAYEPVWAIGSGKNATREQVDEVHHHIRHWLKKYFDAPTANLIKILYGGSVNPKNAAELMSVTQVDGLLVGGASLDAEAFAKIIQFELKE